MNQAPRSIDSIMGRIAGQGGLQLGLRGANGAHRLRPWPGRQVLSGLS